MTFRVDMTAKMDQAQSVAGGGGNKNMRSGVGRGLRKAIALIEKTHKTELMRPGGGARFARQPEFPYILTRTGTLKKSYTRDLDYRRLKASYGTPVKYGLFLEEGTRRGIRARHHMRRLDKRVGKKVERIMADAAVKGLTGGK